VAGAKRQKVGEEKVREDGKQKQDDNKRKKNLEGGSWLS
jgi:hypothetical protein